MTEKQLEKVINNFVKLNPKTNFYTQKNKQLLNSFLLVKNLFKDNLKLINQGNYDKIFSSKNGKFLSGKNWLEILLSSDSIIEYYTNLRRKYEICDQKKLKKNINDDFFAIYYHDEKIALIEATEINFDINTKTKLEKLRNYLEQKEWGIYFFELQKLMHEQIIKLLKWENKSLNYNSYINFLNEKLNNHLNDSNTIKNFNQIINQINYYRNLLSKATSNIANNTVKWNNLNGLSQKVIAWDLYYQINNFINLINLLLEKK